MSYPSPTLKDLFVPDGSYAPLTGMASALGGLQWHGLYDHAFDVLDVNVVDTLLAGWKKHGEVQSQLRATAADPARTAMVRLLRHTLESTHTPSIEVRSQGKVMANVSLPIEVAFEIEAVTLVIRGGAVDEIRPGNIAFRGTMKLEHSVILERKLAPIQLPGKITLGRAAA
jgi:hypothetical protein